MTTKVVFIVGSGRSGSTLLGNLLGEVDGYLNVGELKRLWKAGLIERRFCGCGLPVPDCAFWSSVVQEVGGPRGDRVDPAQIVGWEQDSLRFRHTLKILRASRTGTAADGSSLHAYAEVQQRVYAAIAKLSEARVIVDTSKSPPSGALLTLIPEIEPFFVHLVRDPRAVAYSWSRRKSRPDSAQPDEMLRHGPVRSALGWLGYNAASESLSRGPLGQRYLRLKYEAMVADPREAMAAIANLCGEEASSLPTVHDSIVRLRVNHTVAGNPDRFRHGDVKVQQDEAWREHLPSSHKLIATALAFPMIARYGYELWPARGRDGRGTNQRSQTPRLDHTG